MRHTHRSCKLQRLTALHVHCKLVVVVVVGNVHAQLLLLLLLLLLLEYATSFSAAHYSVPSISKKSSIRKQRLIADCWQSQTCIYCTGSTCIVEVYNTIAARGVYPTSLPSRMQ